MKQLHKEYLDNKINPLVFKRWTWSSVKSKLIDEFSEIGEVSSSTVGRFLKNEMNMSYKILEHKPAPATTLISIRKLLESASIHFELLSKGVELIFIDEFFVSTRHHKFRGWVLKGLKCIIKTDSNQYSITFICGVSNISAYGLIGSLGSNRQVEMMHYLRQLCETHDEISGQDSKRFIIIYDNSNIHTGSDIKDFISESKLRTISIPPSTPMLNSCEKLISSVKSKLIMMQAEGK